MNQCCPQISLRLSSSSYLQPIFLQTSLLALPNVALLFFNFIPWFCSLPHLEVLMFLHFSIINFACVSSLFNRLLHLEAPSRYNVNLLCILLPNLLYWAWQFSYSWAVLIPLLETPGWGQLTKCFALLCTEFDLFLEYAAWLMIDHNWSPNKK